MKKLIIALFAILTAGTAGAQRMSLPEILDSISAGNPVVKMYNAEIKSMDASVKGARSWMPPQVEAGIFMAPYNASLWQKNGDMNGMGSAMFSVQQMFPNRKKLDANENLMKAISSVEKEKLYASLNENYQNAKSMYYDWLIIDKKQKIVKENEQMLSFMIKNAEIRYKNGLDKMSAYYKAKAALGTSKDMQLMYNNDIREKRIRLNALMGKNAMEPLEIVPDYTLNDYSLESFDSDLFNEKRSDLKAIDRQIDITKLQQDLEKQNLKPEFGVKYDNMYGFGGQPFQFSLMLMAKLPFVSWASKMNKANIESLEYKKEALDAQKKMMVNEYSGMAYGMRNELELSKNRLKLYEDTIIPALKNNYKAMQLGYEQNTEELFMLYDAWEKLNMTQLEYLEILTKALNTQTEIDRLIERK